MSKEKISKYLLSSCNKALKQKVEKFLFEEEEIEFSRAELNKIKFYNYSLFLELDIFNKNKTMKKSEDSNIIKRLFSLGYNCCPEKLISELSAYPFGNRMTIYKNLGVSNEFLAKDLEFFFSKNNNIGNFSAIIEDVNKKFPKFLDYYLTLENFEKNRYIIIEILNLKYFNEKIEIIPQIEEFILNSLSEIYSYERIKNILKYDFKDNKLIEVLKETDIVNDDEELIYFLQDFYLNLNIENENRKTLLGIFEILTFSDSIDSLEIETSKEYFEFINNSNLPFIYKLVYLYAGSENYDISLQMETFILNNYKEALEILDRMLIQNIELGAFILGILINNKLISEDLKKEFINKFIDKIDSIFKRLIDSRDRELGIELINTLGYILVFSDVEKYIAQLSEFYEKNRWDINEFINLIAHFERLDNKNKNPWEILAEKTAINKKFLISGTMDFVNISSDEQFTKFLKANEEIFYELLEKKTFIDFTFDEILDLSYRTDVDFDVTKLLPYLSLSDEILLENVFEILKDKEKECKAEVEKLSKTKNKKVLSNIKELQKIWEGNQGTEFKDYSQLEKYVFSIFDNYKKDVLYPKLETYSQVRLKDSEILVDEKVIKLYVALYMNNDLEDIALGNTIKNFINIEDLNKCLDTLFDTWISDNTPLHNSSIAKICLLATDDYMTHKVLSLLEESLKKLKLPLVKKLAPICYNLDKKELYTELQYIKAGIQYKELKNILNDDFNFSFDNLFNNFDFSLGFDKNGEKTFDYGNRKIKLVLNKNLDVSIFNQDGKELKSLPKYSIKFKDNENRVDFYQKEFKNFKKKREFLTYELRKYMFSLMIGDKAWTSEEWKEEIENIFIIKTICENILWKITSNNKEFFCKYTDSRFIDIKSNSEISDIQNIKIFYSGEVEENVEQLSKNLTSIFLPQQFKIFKVPTDNIEKYIGLPISFEKITLALNNYYADFNRDGSFPSSKEKLVIVDKLNHILLTLVFSLFSENNKLETLNLTGIFGDTIEVEKINPRFLNFVHFLLKELTTLDM